MSLVLETKRLKMRAFQDRDIKDFPEYRSDPNVAKYQDWDTPYSVEKAVQFVEDNKVIRPGSPGEGYQMAIELKLGGNLIGDCAFHILAEDAQKAEIGYTLSRRYQGYGYATEAVTRLVAYLFW